MSFPIDFLTTTLVMNDGNRTDKFYHLMLMMHEDGPSLLIKRYGKNNGKIGNFLYEKFVIQAAAEREYEKIMTQKLGKGYEKKSFDIKQINSETELRMAVGPAIWPLIPAGEIKHILPEMNTSGRPAEALPPRFSENGKYLGERPPRVFSEAEIRAAREAQKIEEQAESAKTYATNKRFGIF